MNNNEKYRIFPDNAELKQQEAIQFCVFRKKEDGSEEKVGGVVWQEISGGGYIDPCGMLTPINLGDHKLEAKFDSDDDSAPYEEITLSTNYKVIPGDGRTLNQKFLDSKCNALAEKLREIRAEGIEEASPEKKISIEEEQTRFDEPIQKKKVTIKQLIQEHEEPRKKTVMGHTRAIYRALAANQDLVWLVFLCIFAVCFGGCVILLMDGFSTEKISAFLVMFLGLVISFFGKLYTPPGEVSEAIGDRILGVSDEDKIKKLETKLNRLTTKVQKKNQNQSFYKYTIDENSMM